MRISSSHSIEMKDPSPFRNHELRSDMCNTEPLYTGWIYDTFNIDSIPQTYKTKEVQKSPTKFKTTTTFRCLVYFARYATYKAHVDIADESQIVFWSDVSSFTQESEKVQDIIKSQFQKFFQPVSIIVCVDSQFVSIEKLYLNKSKPSQRVVFHYCGYSPLGHDPESLIFSSPKFYEEIKITKILQTVGNCSTIIIDDDYSGSLLEPLIKYVENNKSKDIDIVAFFSCQKDEFMPLSKNFPTDIFTACMTTPGKMALVCHSRNYFCFSETTLQPLQPLFMSALNDDENKIIEQFFEEIELVLECTVQAIAYRVLDPDLYAKLFRSDPSLMHLTCNFILACRLLSSFNINPCSYPLLPDMSQEPEWGAFDLRLDTVLTQIQAKQLSISTFNQFLDGAYKSIKYVLTAPILNNYPPLELAFIKLVLKNNSYSADACNALAVFLNSSLQAIDWALQFDIFPSVFNVLETKKAKTPPPVLFCIIKMLAYCPELREKITAASVANCIEHCFIPILQSNDLIVKRLGLITIVLLLHDSVINCRQALKTNELLNVAYVKEFPRWSLHLINCIVSNSSDSSTDSLLDIVCNCETEGDIEKELCVLAALESFIQSEGATNSLAKKKNIDFFNFGSNKTEKVALQQGLKFSNSLSAIVRREVLILFSRFVSTHKIQFIESQKPLYNTLRVFFAQCLLDPAPSVKDLAMKIEKNLQSDTDIVQKSNIIDLYLASLLENISQLLADSNPTFSKVLSQPVGETPVIQIKRNVSLHHLSAESDVKRMKIVSQFKHNSKITTNLVLQASSYSTSHKNKLTSQTSSNNISSSYGQNEKNPKYFYFGDENGYITRKSIKESQNPENNFISRKIADDPITSVNYQQNFGFPLLFTATQTGKIFTHFVNDKFELNFANAFILQDEENMNGSIPKAQNYQIEINPFSMHMYTYYKGAKFFEERDLRTNQKITSIKAPDNRAVCFKPITKYTDIIALAGESLCIYDLRQSYTEPVITRDLDSPVFSFDILDDNIPSFSICSDHTSVGLMDSRYPTGMRTVKLWLSEQSSDETICFGTNRDNSIAALGHQTGITCVNLVNGQQTKVPNISITFTSSKVPKPSFITSFQQKLLFVNETNEIITVNFL